jgi:hypothetical protein
MSARDEFLQPLQSRGIYVWEFRPFLHIIGLFCLQAHSATMNTLSEHFAIVRNLILQHDSPLESLTFLGGKT